MAGGRSQRHMKHVQGKAANGDTTNGPFAPRVNAKPTISGTATSGQTLTGTNATFLNEGPTRTIVRAWLRNGVAVAGQTGATYVLSGADVGATIKFRNTVTSNMGSVVTDSNATATVS